MTENQHRVLYNIGMNLSCDNIAGIHLCPDEPTYQYIMYFVESKKNNVKLQLKKRTGEYKITEITKAQICPEYSNEKRIRMAGIVLDKATNEERMKELRANNEMAKAVLAVGLEKTRMLRKELEEGDIYIMDFVDAFDENAMLIHFGSLFRGLLQEISEGHAGASIIEKFVVLLDNWEKIYQHNERILKQIENYINMMLKGLEKIISVKYDIETIVEERKKVILDKYNATDCLSFFFREDVNKERFQRWATILYDFLGSCAEGHKEIREVVKKAREALEKYVIKDLNYNEIRGLEKLNLKSKVELKANAKKIERYLRKDTSLDLGMFELIA